METEALQGASLMFIISGLVCGGLVGLILQRGRFCMNSAFRDTIFIKEYNLFQAYLIALIIMLIGGNAMADMGMIHLKAQTFFPMANILGGYVFGLGMVMAGGCGSGIIYRVGEGQLASIMAVFGFLFGIGATTNGIFKPFYNFLRSFKMAGAEGAPYTLYGLIGDTPMIKWAVIAVFCAACFAFVLTGKPFSFGKQKGFFWSVAGALIGIMGLVTFWASEYWGSPGFARGMNFTTPAGETMFTFLTGDARSMFFPMFDLAGFKVTWGEFFYIGVPVGAFISAKILKEFKWKIPPAQEMLTVLGGSFLMGFGASCAGGCNVGQALTGFTTLSIGSIVATIAIILGNWTMVYFKFIKPMADME
ncbi:MAG: YeeE/YedE family protein [Nitrospiraceae bacterium]|nr:YeeE/YedE family protein [Nitrospiraceae bacterium]